MNRGSPRPSVRYQLPLDAYASCSWLKRPMPVSRFCAPVAGSISQTQPERRSGSLRNGNSSFVRYVFHGVIVAAQRSCSPVVISSAFLTVVPSLPSVSREIEPQPSESSSPGVCSSTWHLPASPWKSPWRGWVSSCWTSSQVFGPGAWKSALPSGSSGIGYVTPLSVDCSGVTQPVAIVVYENPGGRLSRPAGSGTGAVPALTAIVRATPASATSSATRRSTSPSFSSWKSGASVNHLSRGWRAPNGRALSCRRALLPATRRGSAQAAHPVPRQRDAADRRGDGPRGLLG